MKICKRYDYITPILIYCILASLAVWICSIFWGGADSSQFNFFYGSVSNLFADFTNVCGYSAERDVYRNAVNGMCEKGYPPLTYVFANIFSRIDRVKPSAYTSSVLQPKFLIMFMLFITSTVSTVFFLVSQKINGSQLKKYLGAVAITFSGYMLFVIERGNFFLLMMPFYMFFIFEYDSPSKVKREFALICLAITAAFKLTPAIFGIFLLFDKRYKEAIRTVIYGLIFFFVPFLFFKGGFNNILLMFSNMKEFISTYSDGIELNSIVYIALRKVLGDSYLMSDSLCSIINIFAMTCSAALVLVSKLFKKKWMRVFAVSLALILAPSFSNSYNVLYLLPAMVLFLNEENKSFADIFYMLAFLLICCPLQFKSFLNTLFSPQVALAIIYVTIAIQSTMCLIRFLSEKSLDKTTQNLTAK